MPDFFTVLKERRSVRKFKKKEVPMELIEKIIEAGTWAPSAMNSQPWEFIVVRTPEGRRRIRQIYDEASETAGFYKQNTEFIENATLILALSNTEKILHTLSTAAAIENILLAATAFGLGSVWTCRALRVEKSINELKEFFQIPQKYEIIGIIAIGYPDEKPLAKERRKLGEVIHREKF